MKTVACIIARMGSSRLPGKVLAPVSPGYPMMKFIVERIKMCQQVDEIYICTTREKEDDPLEGLAKELNVGIYRGSTEVVIERFMTVGENTEADLLIRITGDNVFTSYEYLDQQVELAKKENLDYVRIIDAPLGATAEVMSFKAIQHCYATIDPEVSEYLLMFMFNPDKYNCAVIKPFKEDFSHFTITVDTDEDLQRTQSILALHEGDPMQIKLADIISILQENEIANSLFSMDQTVKMPYGELMSYRDFKSDMKDRESRSRRIELYN